MKRIAFLIGLVLLATGCSSTTVADSVDPAAREWTEILGEAIRLRTAVAFGDELGVQTRWSETSPYALTVLFDEPVAELRIVLYTLVPWQSFGPSPGHLRTVTEHTLLFGPKRTAGPLRQFEQRAEGIIVKAANLGRNEQVWSPERVVDRPGVMIGRLRFTKRHYSRYDLQKDVKLPPLARLVRLTPGKMLWLTTGGASDRWIAPAPYRPKTPASFDPGEQQLEPGTDLAGARPQMDKQLRTIFRETLAEALASADKSPKVRTALLVAARARIEPVISAYPGHSGPAHAAGAAAFEKMIVRLARMLVLEETLTPDWVRPSVTGLTGDDGSLPVALLEGRPLPDALVLPEATVTAIPELLTLLAEAKLGAVREPGQWTRGRIELGAAKKQYVPSRADLRVARIGGRLELAVAAATADNLSAVLKKANMAQTDVTFYRFEFRQVAVAGTGLFRYASGPIPVTLTLAK